MITIPRCPTCHHNRNVLLSPAQGVSERLLARLQVYAFRCNGCRSRFRRFRLCEGEEGSVAMAPRPALRA
jgi:hypothetical protein